MLLFQKGHRTLIRGTLQGLFPKTDREPDEPRTAKVFACSEIGFLGHRMNSIAAAAAINNQGIDVPTAHWPCSSIMLLMSTQTEGDITATQTIAETPGLAEQALRTPIGSAIWSSHLVKPLASSFENHQSCRLESGPLGPPL